MNLIEDPNMVDQRQVFAISEHFLRTRRRLIVVLAMTMFILVPFFVAIENGMNFESGEMASLALSVAILLGLILAVFVLVGHYTFRRFRQLKLYLGPDGLAREAGATRQEMAWGDITKARVRRNPRGEPRAVEIFTTGGRPLALFGFEPAAEVVRLVQERLPPMAQVETKRARLDWENPFITVAGIAAVVLVFGVVRWIAGWAVFESIILVIQLASGIFFLAYGPVSRTFPGFRKWEVGLGVLILVLVLVQVCLKVAE
ncbi:MAG: hypothetical protein ACE5H0_13320 [Bacteroidota bacterium]